MSEQGTTYEALAARCIERIRKGKDVGQQGPYLIHVVKNPGPWPKGFPRKNRELACVNAWGQSVYWVDAERVLDWIKKETGQNPWKALEAKP